MARTIARPPDPPYNAEKVEGPSHHPCTNTIYPLAGCPVLIGARQAGATGSPTGSSGFRKVPPQRSLKKSIRAALNRTGFFTLGSSGFRSGVGRAPPRSNSRRQPRSQPWQCSLRADPHCVRAACPPPARSLAGFYDNLGSEAGWGPPPPL